MSTSGNSRDQGPKVASKGDDTKTETPEKKEAQKSESGGGAAWKKSKTA